VSAIALSLIMILFTEPAERAKAMGMIGFVLSGGGAAGVLIGGLAFYLVALLLFSRAPVDGNDFVDVLPGMLVLGIGEVE
jgi:hypothetical protein